LDLDWACLMPHFLMAWPRILLRWLATFCLLLFAAPAPAEQVDFGALERYGAACTMLKAAILADQGAALHTDDHAIKWISECNGNIPACWDARKAIRQAKRASPLDCLGRVQSAEAASAAYSLYRETTSPLPRCIERRC
jgi:hypothetical protein